MSQPIKVVDVVVHVNIVVVVYVIVVALDQRNLPLKSSQSQVRNS